MDPQQPQSPVSEPGLPRGTAKETKEDANALYYTLETYTVPDAGQMLSRKNLATVMSEADSLKSRLNAVSYNVTIRENYRKRLHEQYAALLRENAQAETRARQEKRIVVLCAEEQSMADQIAFEQINTRAYTNVLKREEGRKLEAAARIEFCKAGIKKTQTLGEDTIKVEEEPRKAETEGQENLRKISELRVKVEEGERQYVQAQREIAESKARVQRMDDETGYFAKKTWRLINTLKQIKKKREAYEEMKQRLVEYKREYETQYARLKREYDASNKEEILRKKDIKELQAQTENLVCQEKVDRLRTLTETCGRLKEELAQHRAEFERSHERMVERQRLLDKGEYNPDAVSKEYVEKAGGLKRYKWELEEKIDVVRNVISGVKHIIFRLQKNDRWSELGTWYDPSVIAAIDDISTSAARPKVSRLLLLLEQKIVAFFSLVMQRVKALEEDAAVDDDNMDVELDYLPEGGALVCLGVLRDCLRRMTGQGDRSARVSRKFTALNFPEFRPIVGAGIPKIVERNKQAERMEAANAGEKSESPMRRRGVPVLLGSDPGVDPDLDMLSLTSNMLGMFSKRRLEKLERQPSLPVASPHQSELENENVAICAKFASKRLKQKLEQGLPKGTPRTEQGKKHLTKLTLRIERQMADRPHQLVDMATRTFDVLDKMRRTGGETAIFGPKSKTSESIRKAMPNFVSAVVNLKKARKGERIEKIAQKCHYFPGIRLFSTSTDFGATQKRISKPRLDPTKEAMQDMDRRLANLKSLQQMETVPRRTCLSAFDEFCGTRAAVDTKVRKKAAAAKFEQKPRGSVMSSPGSVAHRFRQQREAPALYSVPNNVSETTDQTLGSTHLTANLQGRVTANSAMRRVVTESDESSDDRKSRFSLKLNWRKGKMTHRAILSGGYYDKLMS